MNKVITVLLILLAIFTFGVVSVPAASVTLAWEHSPDTNVVVAYRVYYGGGSGVYSNYTTTGYVTTATISNLTYGIYYFAATALDNQGLESSYSNEVIWTNALPIIYTVSLSQTNTSVKEGDQALTFFGKLSSGVPSNMVAKCIIAGTAINGIDYTNYIWHAPSGRFLLTNVVNLTFAPGNTQAMSQILLLNDTVAETNKSIIITLSAGSGYTVGTPSAIVFTLLDNDTPPSPPSGFRFISAQ